jgi:TolB-like protein/Flp pilus assembly protein TadD
VTARRVIGAPGSRGLPTTACRGRDGGSADTELTTAAPPARLASRRGEDIDDLPRRRRTRAALNSNNLATLLAVLTTAAPRPISAKLGVARGAPMTAETRDHPMTEPSKAVFLSYASEDAEAARRLCETLRAAGVEVWFDRSELRGGDAWDRKIARQIRECALFIALISANTEARDEGYFRREWRLAVDRTRDLADDKAFLLPVVIDATADATARVPEKLREVQWTRLPAGEVTPAFTERITGLLSGRPAAAAGASVSPVAPGAAATARRAPEGARSEPAARALRPGPALIALGLLIAAGLGYFVVHLSGSHNVTADAPVEALKAIPEKSVAVLPFTDMSEKHDQEFFSDGLSEELIDMLAKVPQLRVPARTSSFYFKGRPEKIATIASELGVAHILEGSVRKAGDRLRVSAQLIRADDGHHLWSETYDRDAKDVFQVQDEIAAAVVGALKVTLLAPPDSAARQTSSAEAYSQYLVARQIIERGDWKNGETAVSALRRALAIDPGYAAAWAELAVALDSASEDDSVSTADWQKAKLEAFDASDRAIALAPKLADGYESRGYLRAWIRRDFKGAAEDYQRALALAPDSADALKGYAGAVLAPTGRLDEALSTARRVLQLDPLSAASWRLLGYVLWMRKECPASVAANQHSLAISPQQASTATYIAFCQLLEGKPADALASGQRETQVPLRLGASAMALHDLKRTAESDRQLAELVRGFAGGAAYQVAEVYAWRGEREPAFVWLERAYVQRDGGLTILKCDPMLERLHGDARYSALLQRMNLSE